MSECKACKGTGKQVFHGHFDSVLGRCNFCGGTGNRVDELRWYKELPERIKKRNKERVNCDE